MPGLGVHENRLLTTYACMLITNAHADTPNKARGQQFGLGLHLHAYSVYVSSEGSGESVHMRRFA